MYALKIAELNFLLHKITTPSRIHEKLFANTVTFKTEKEIEYVKRTSDAHLHRSPAHSGPQRTWEIASSVVCSAFAVQT